MSRIFLPISFVLGALSPACTHTRGSHAEERPAAPSPTTLTRADLAEGAPELKCDELEFERCLQARMNQDIEFRWHLEVSDPTGRDSVFAALSRLSFPADSIQPTTEREVVVVASYRKIRTVLVESSVARISVACIDPQFCACGALGRDACEAHGWCDVVLASPVRVGERCLEPEQMLACVAVPLLCNGAPSPMFMDERGQPWRLLVSCDVLPDGFRACGGEQNCKALAEVRTRCK